MKKYLWIGVVFAFFSTASAGTQNTILQDLVSKKLIVSMQKEKELNNMALLAIDPAFHSLVATFPFNRDLLYGMRKLFNMKNFSADENDYFFMTSNNQSLDDLIQKGEILIRYGGIRVRELQKNRGAPAGVRAFTTAGAAGQFRSGVFSNLKILNALKPIANSKDYLGQKGDCGTENKTPATSQSGNRYRDQLNRQGQYMSDETGSSGMPANPDTITGANQGPSYGGKTYENFTGTGVSETWSTETRPDGTTVHTLESAEYDFSDEPAQLTGSPDGQKQEKKEVDKKTEPAAETTPEATPEPESEPEQAVTNMDDITPKEDSGGSLLVFCARGGHMARNTWGCQGNRALNKVIGSDDPWVLKEESSGTNAGIRFEGHTVKSRWGYDTHVGLNDPYIIPTDEGGRGQATLGADGCGGGVVRGSIVGNTFCYQAEDGDSRCDDGSGGGLPAVPGGGTEPGDNPIPNPIPGPR